VMRTIAWRPFHAVGCGTPVRLIGPPTRSAAWCRSSSEGSLLRRWPTDVTQPKRRLCKVDKSDHVCVRAARLVIPPGQIACSGQPSLPRYRSRSWVAYCATREPFTGSSATTDTAQRYLSATYAEGSAGGRRAVRAGRPQLGPCRVPGHFQTPTHAGTVTRVRAHTMAQKAVIGLITGMEDLACEGCPP
jgi:hypothetical protein